MSKKNDQKRLSGHMWLSDSFRPGSPSLGISALRVSRQSQRTGQTRPTRLVRARLHAAGSVPKRRWKYPPTCTEPPSQIDFSELRNDYTAQMLLWRPVTPGDYWWP